jgi:hypothetical protein
VSQQVRFATVAVRHSAYAAGPSRRSARYTHSALVSDLEPLCGFVRADSVYYDTALSDLPPSCWRCRAKLKTLAEQDMTPCCPSEDWRPIIGAYGAYEVSSCGRVRSFLGKRGGVSEAPRLITGSTDPDGYRQVLLRRDGRSRTWKVHRLVAEAFLGVPAEGCQVGHLDGSRTNHHASNLAWVTIRENALHKRIHGTMTRGETHHKAKLTTAQVRDIKRRMAAGETGQSLALEYGMSKSVVCEIGAGKGWIHV